MATIAPDIASVILESANDCLWFSDTAGRLLYVNAAAEALLGYTREEMLRWPSFDPMVHEEDRDRVAAVLAHAAAERGGWSGEVYRARRKDGSERWLESNGRAIVDSAGDVIGFAGADRDIQARIEAEQRLEQSERDYRALFESSSDAILVVDVETQNVVAANPRAYGLYSDGLIGLPIASIAHDFPVNRRAVEEMIAKGGPPIRLDGFHRRGDGTEIELEVTLTAVQYGGRPAVLNTSRDLTERNSLQRELADSEQRFRSIVEHGYDIIVITGAKTSRSFAGTVEKHLGYASGELPDETLLALVHPDDREMLLAALERVRGCSECRVDLTIRVRDRAGAWRCCEGTAVDMRNVEGVNGVVLIGRDVTDRAELAARLEQTRRVDSLGRVAATVAHEFNNVLMGMQPVAEVLTRKFAGQPDVGRLAAQLGAGVQRGRRIVQSILRFANPPEPSRQRIAIRPWLNAVTAELRPLTGAHIDLVLAPGEDLNVNADADQLHQLVTNLIMNARDVMPRGGTIELAAIRVDRWVEISVRDTGPGIPPEVLPRLFEPLFTTKRNGTGIGLTVCEQIVTMHGGSIHASSAPGEGAVFRARLAAAA
ncbi:MAG: PAS domain S-box protein [Thermoanaerobaculia bacterium]